MEFNLAAGAHGLGVALGSEVFKLSEAERDQATRIVVDQVAGRVPVVINTGAAGTDLAVYYSQTVEQNGADALMIMPPAFMPAGPDEVLDYFRAISNAVGIPIFLQDTPSAPISPLLARQIAGVCEYYERGLVAPGVDYETPPPYLEVIGDPMDEAGYVHLPQEPGLGYRIIWDYIDDHRIRS